LICFYWPSLSKNLVKRSGVVERSTKIVSSTPKTWPVPFSLNTDGINIFFSLSIFTLLFLCGQISGLNWAQFLHQKPCVFFFYLFQKVWQWDFKVTHKWPSYLFLLKQAAYSWPDSVFNLLDVFFCSPRREDKFQGKHIELCL